MVFNCVHVAALEHVLFTVFGMDSKSPLVQALEMDCVQDIADFLTLSNDDIDCMTYPVAQEGTICLVPVPEHH